MTAWSKWIRAIKWRAARVADTPIRFRLDLVTESAISDIDVIGLYILYLDFLEDDRLSAVSCKAVKLEATCWAR